MDQEWNILQTAAFYSAENIVRYLVDKFAKDKVGKIALIEYQEPSGGNMALHFAVLKGNPKIINMIINDLGASPM